MYLQSLLTALLTTLPLTTALPSPLDERTTCSAVGISATDAAAVKSAFSAAKLTPQAIHSGINPKVKVSAAYGSKAVNLGNTFMTTETINAPSISFTAESDHDPATTKYLVFLVDPDAPGPTDSGAPAALSFFLHTAIYNAQPSCIKNQSPETVTVPGYRSLTPLSVAAHRYTFLVYRQPPGFAEPNQLALVTSNFDLNGFVSQNGLVLVGGNFFREGLGSNL